MNKLKDQWVFDFIIWSEKNILIIPVNFDKSYWDDMKSALIDFFRKYIASRIICGKHSITSQGGQHTGTQFDLNEDDDECVAAMESHEVSVQAQVCNCIQDAVYVC